MVEIREAQKFMLKLCIEGKVSKIRCPGVKIVAAQWTDSVPGPCIQAFGLPHLHPVSVGRDDG